MEFLDVADLTTLDTGSPLETQVKYMADARRRQRRTEALAKIFTRTPDGKQIVFDRLRENSDIVLIDLPAKP